MKPVHIILLIGLFFSLFIGGLATFYTVDEKLDSGEWASRSESSVKKSKSKKDGRDFEDSIVTSKTDKVADEPSALFNDPAISKAWGLKKADAGRAWSVSRGSKEIIVAVIDTGADVKHEDLKSNIWKNPGETGLDSKGRDKATNGIDDDKNGFVDDVSGWNFVSNDNDLTDNHGHGTHIAGIIGAEAGNNKGISGIAPEVSLMILKYYDPKKPNTDNLKNTVAAIKYAVNKGAHIINYSGGGLEFSKDEFEAIASAQKKGILFVGAAGNERSNSDKFHYYPADYQLDNIISVTAIDPSTEVLSSSNYGVETVHIAAPGQNILSTLPGNNYGGMTGTSQATAFVSGAGVLIMAKIPSYKNQASEVKKYILSTGDATTSLASKTRTSRQLNLFKCLTVLDQDITASGIVMADPGKTKSLSQMGESKAKGDPNAALSGDNISEMTTFSKDLIKAIHTAPLKKDKIGNDTKSNEN